MEKLEYAKEFMGHIVDHCIDGGSFRYLIYGRLGFGEEAYGPLYEAGGMEFTNACPINMEKETCPTFSWAGIAWFVGYEEGGRCTVQWIGGEKREVELWEPEKVFIEGETVLVVYFSRPGKQLNYALKAGVNYAAHKLADG